jgi:lauroyl/myristoyl acyltransferase
MPEQSWFDPNQTFKNPDRYAGLIGTPYASLCADLQVRFDAEQAQPARQKERDELRAQVADHLTSIQVFDRSPAVLANQIVNTFFQVFYLEQLLLTLSASRDDFFGEIVEIRGLDAVREHVAADGGVQFALPHYGPHFLVHMLLAKLGLGCSVGGAMTDDCAQGHRGWAKLLGIDLDDLEAVSFTDGFGKAMAQLGRSGRSLTMYPEYSRSKRLGRYTADFLGQTVHLPTGVAKLAKLTERKLVGVRLHRTEKYRYILEFGPTFSVGNATGQTDVPTAAAAIMGWVEQMVLEDPELWEGWRYYHLMKANGFKVLLRNLAASRRKLAV